MHAPGYIMCDCTMAYPYETLTMERERDQPFVYCSYPFKTTPLAAKNLQNPEKSSVKEQNCTPPPNYSALRMHFFNETSKRREIHRCRRPEKATTKHKLQQHISYLRANLINYFNVFHNYSNLSM